MLNTRDRATFADPADLVLAVFDDAVEQARAAMLAACGKSDTWVDAVRAALCALLAFFDRDPNRARLLVVSSFSGESAMRARRVRLLRELADALEAGRPGPPAASADPPFGTDAVVAAAAAILHARLLEEPVPPLSPLSASLMAWIVLPYLGVGAARGELARETSPTGDSQVRGAGSGAVL
jgi:AcrR family transcriptional regulator